MTAIATHIGHMATGAIAHVRVGLIQLAQYRVSFAIWALASTLQAVVALAVWQAVAEAGGGSIRGYDAGDFAGYFLVVLVVRELTYTGIAHHLPSRVERGTFATYLMRPLHPLVQTFGVSFANTIQSLVFVLPIALALTAAFQATISPAPAAVAAAFALVPFAILTRACADSLVATSSFWLVRISGIRGIYFMCTLLLGGQFAPLAVLQPVWRAGTRAYEAVGT